MSAESAVAFYERLEKDIELQEKLKELGTKEKIEQHVKGELGYDFTLEEMQKVIFEKNPDLTDDELEAVVGGNINVGVVVGGLVGIVGLAGIGVAAGAFAGFTLFGVVAAGVAAA